MVKCLNIGKNIGKPIYRSISNIVLVVLTRCGLTLSSILQKTFKRPRYTSNEVCFYSSFGAKIHWKRLRDGTVEAGCRLM